MRKKKNRFLLFCCSMIPGAGEMYLGFMKTGFSLLCLFAASIALTGFTNMGILSTLVVVIWIYGFFHANNLGALSDEELNQIEDKYLLDIDGEEMEALKKKLSGKWQKTVAVLLILFGASMLWQVIDDIIRWCVGDELYWKYFGGIFSAVGDATPRLLAAILIIWIGVKLIKGKKVELEQIEAQEKMEVQEKIETQEKEM